MPTIAISDEIRVFTVTRQESSCIIDKLKIINTDQYNYIIDHLYDYSVKKTELRPIIVTPEHYETLYNIFTTNKSITNKFVATMRDECYYIVRL